MTGYRKLTGRARASVVGLRRVGTMRQRVIGGEVVVDDGGRRSVVTGQQQAMAGKLGGGAGARRGAGTENQRRCKVR